MSVAETAFKALPSGGEITPQNNKSGNFVTFLVKKCFFLLKIPQGHMLFVKY
jgi:hypothetical protein